MQTLEQTSLRSPSISTQKPFLIDVMSKKQKRTFVVLVTAWVCALAFFWQWWLQAEHVLSWIDMLIVSLLIAWQTVIPGYYFYFVARMKRFNPAIEIPHDWRVAMVVTKAPSEPWSIVKKTLEAMLAQQHPHDVWLADESPQTETIKWCQARGVNISSREGIAAYHQPTWPRRTRCKEGNLAYFYDTYAYDRYDVVVQLDADHVPEPNYLEEMIRPFVNPGIGYVAAPSICDANAGVSWVVNARAFAEGSMHGSLQAGYNNGWAPVCIGSHYAVRTSALKEIGGLGPELAEDHSTTLMMNAHGWRGIFALDAIAHGDGPASFPDFLLQEFQWSRSLTMLLLSVTPRYVKKLPPHLRFQFAFSQFWYPLYGACIGLGMLTPLIALLRDTPWVNVSYGGFLLHSVALDIACLTVVSWVSAQGWFRPQNAKVFSWEIILFQLARWPWVLAGVGSALFAWALRQELSFRVTPKGNSEGRPLPMSVMAPYLILAIASAVAVIFLTNVEFASGYYFLAMVNGGFYVFLCVAIVWSHLQENKPQHNEPRHKSRRPKKSSSSRYALQKVSILTVFGLFCIALSLRGPEAVASITADINDNFLRSVLMRNN